MEAAVRSAREICKFERGSCVLSGEKDAEGGAVNLTLDAVEPLLTVAAAPI